MDDIEKLSREVGSALLAQRLRLVTAESCTGGWLAKSLTDIAGSSSWFERGFVTYSNEAKREMLAVQRLTLETSGAVSEETVIEMAAGALEHSLADLSVAISGIAGPGGSTPGKPVGTVCFAWADRRRPPRSETRHFQGNRDSVRRQSVCHALRGIRDGLRA